MSGEHALHNEEVSSPVTEADDEAEAEDNAGPVNAHRIVVEVAEGAPHMNVIAAPQICENLLAKITPATDFDQTQNRHQQRTQPDEQELQDFIEDRGTQAAERYVKSDSNRRNPDAEVQVPAEYHLHHDGHRIHIDAAHQNGHKGEADGRERAGSVTVAQMQIAGHRMRLRDVVEGHHDDAEEEHGRNRTNPIPVRGEDAILISRSGPSHQFQ